MKHDEILGQLIADANNDPNVVGFLVFGSVASGTHREDSDIDVITVLQTSKPASGMSNTPINGIKVGNLYLAFDVLLHGVHVVPYLLHPLVDAKLLLDSRGVIKPLLEKISEYYNNHPEIVQTWNTYYKLLKEEKDRFGYEKTTIVDVWNEIEKKYSGGKIKRQFFNSFYMTNPFIFSVLKKFL